MAADQYSTGSVLYKVLIVLLAAALIVAIVYPKSMWEEETAKQELCRERMANLYAAELQFRNFHQTFSPSSAAVMRFIKTDARYLRCVDSLVVEPLRESKDMLDSLRQMQVFAVTLIGTLIAASPDSAIIDSVDRLEDKVIEGSRRLRQIVETVRERMATLPNMPAATLDDGVNVVGRKEYFFKMEVVKRMLTVVGNLQLAHVSSKEALANFELLFSCLDETLAKLRTAPALLNASYFCPTAQDSLLIVLVDSSAFQFANIYCPIDSNDLQRVQADFFKSRVGALKIANHGRIERGDKSWAPRP